MWQDDKLFTVEGVRAIPVAPVFSLNGNTSSSRHSWGIFCKVLL